MTKKGDFLKWLFKPRGKDYPFVTYRGGAMKAVVNFVIPFDEVADFFGVDRITINGKEWRKVQKHSSENKGG